LPVSRLKRATGNRVRVVLTTTAFSLVAGFFLPSSTETAEANGDTRTIILFHAHRRDTIEATFRVNGRYDQATLDKLNYFLRDWRNDQETRMDPRLFDTIWEVYRSAGAANEPITVLSAYRSPETNAMLRRRSRAVAEHSQHMLGKAMDTTMPNMSMEKIREIGMRLQRGGVGYYPSSNFVHLDVGGVRSWPRMNYDQLVRLFPDGKTVHIASNGQTLPGYELARAEIEANGGTAAAYAETQQRSRGFFAWLFGGGEDEASEVADARPTQVARRGGRAPATAAAYVASVGSSEGGKPTLAELYGVKQAPAPQAPAAQAAAPQVQRATAEPQEAQPNETRVARTQTARLEPADPRPVPTPPEKPAAKTAAVDDEPDTTPFGAVMPIPPRRPSELTQTAFADIPLPPSRPASVLAFASIEPKDATPLAPGQPAQTKFDAVKINAAQATDTARAADADRPIPPASIPSKPDVIASLISHTVTNNDRVALPSVITRGPQGGKTGPQAAAPSQVLAYAAEPSTASMPGLRSAAQAKTGALPLRGTMAPAQHAPIVSARLDGANFRSLTSTVPETHAPSQSVLAPVPYGLRTAAQTTTQTLSNKPSANYVSHFSTTATASLDTSHFSGHAIESLPKASEEFRQVAKAAH